MLKLNLKFMALKNLIFNKKSGKFFNRTGFILGIIMLVAFLLRFYRLGEVPAFHTDEVDFAHNAYSILKTTKDQTGRFLPLTTASTGDERPAVYVYLSLLPMLVFGFSEFAIRIPSLLFGTATVIATYLLLYEIHKNKGVAIISGFLIAVSFWHITISREASEKTVALFMLIFGAYFLVRYFNTAGKRWFIGSLILFFISTYIYYSPRLFLLLLLPAIWYLFRHKVTKINRIISGGCIGLFILVILYFTLFYGANRERINQLLIFNNPYTMAVLGEQLSEDGDSGNVIISRIFHNKIVNYGFTLFKNYTAHYSPQYLFIEGGEPKRVQVSQVGLINPVELPFIILGLYYLSVLIRDEKKIELLLFPVWILLSAIPSAFTFDEIPNVYRTSLAIPAYSALTALGIWYIYLMRHSLKVRLIFGLTIIAYIWFLGYFMHQYFIHFERHRPIYRNYAQKQLGVILKDSYMKYDSVFITKMYGGTDQVVRFYMRPDPIIYMKEQYPKDSDYTGYGNVKFVPEFCPFPVLYDTLKLDISKRYLFVNSQECQYDALVSPDYIKWGDNSIAYKLIDSKNIPKIYLMSLINK